MQEQARRDVASLTAQLRKAREELRRSKGFFTVPCQLCGGKGHTLVYVGCNCVRDHPYDHKWCETCDGRGWVAYPKEKA